MAFLQVDYNRAIALAKELETAADKCKSSRGDLVRERNNSEAYWKGDAGNALRAQAEAAEKDLKMTQTQLITIAANIRRVAEELKRKDEELARRIRSGGGSSW